MKLSVLFLTTAILGSSNARLSSSHGGLLRQRRRAQSLTTFPFYSQQCEDDEGPRVEDDAETFGAGAKYHTDSQASPVLLANGECADPLKAACSMRNDPKLAYMEGPIDCGGNGFFCTVVEQEDWDPKELLGNLNFGYCNRTGSFDLSMDQYLEDGHCHGSDTDSAYYWVLRDHWFRQYNGRLRCCCNWDQGQNPLSNGLFTNRCDYRRHVPQQEEGMCINANQAAKNFEDGCDPSVQNIQIGNPVPENDSVCWEVSKFGDPNDLAIDGDDDQMLDDDGGMNPGGDDQMVDDGGMNPGDDDQMVDDGGMNPGGDDQMGDDGGFNFGGDDQMGDDGGFMMMRMDGCVDDLAFRYQNKSNRDCGWVGRNADIRCYHTWDGRPVLDFCPDTCGVCV